MAEAWDALVAGNKAEALGILSMLLVGAERAAHDGGRWQVAWLLTLLPEPPAPGGSRPPAGAAQEPAAWLADPEWVATAIDFVQDLDRRALARRRLPTP